MTKLYREIITSKFNKEIIESYDENLIRHFQEPRNYAEVIINQINNERLYDFIFKDKNDLIVLDIGANIGLFSVYIQDAAKAVYCVEPTPTHFNLLSQLTSKFNNINRLQMALHNKDEVLDFYLFDQNTTMNSTVNQYGNKIQVQGITLESILNTNNLEHVDFVKCDIEGSEMMAITMQTVQAVSKRIDTWFLEIHGTEHGNIEQNRHHLKNIFESNGYLSMNVKHDGLFVKRL
jgi:FkbM family methyltransferase